MDNKELFAFVNNVLETIKVDSEQANITYFDDRRIIVSVNDSGKQYSIRTWTINKYGVRYSVFELVADHGIPITDSKYYFFN